MPFPARVKTDDEREVNFKNQCRYGALRRGGRRANKGIHPGEKPLMAIYSVLEQLPALSGCDGHRTILLRYRG